MKKENKIKIKYIYKKSIEGQKRLDKAFDILFEYTLNNMKKRKDIEKGIEFHIKNNDYFGSLATSLSLVSQSLPKEDEKYKEVLNNLVEELLYLKDNYKIINN